MAAPAAAIGAALKSRKSKHGAVTYRIKLIDQTIAKINRAFTQNEDPKGSLINNLLARSETETIDIAKEISDFCSLNVKINVNSEEILNTEEDDNVRPEDYRADVEYIQKMCEYKYNSLDASIAQRMRSLDMVKSAIATKIARIQKGSLPSSRSSSPSRSINIRTNADSMKPATLSYSSATLVSLADHLSSVEDWISNMFPNGFNVTQYRSNLNSTLDTEFHRKTRKFENCESIDDISKKINKLMEIKYPIHLRRMECIKPSMKPNEEASAYFSRLSPLLPP